MSLHQSAYTGDINVIRAAVEENPAVLNRVDHTAGHTLLMAAVSGEKIEVVNYLLGIGADPNIKDVNGYTALHLAAVHCIDDVSILRALVNHGADVFAKSVAGWTPLWLASDSASHVGVSFLLGTSSNAEALVTDGNLPHLARPIRQAVERNDLKMLGLFLSSGIEIYFPEPFLSLYPEAKAFLLAEKLRMQMEGAIGQLAGQDNKDGVRRRGVTL